MADGGDGLAKVFEWVTRAVLSAIVVMMLWNFQILNSLSERVSKLETANLTAFTAKDGLEIWRELSAVKETIARMPVEIPPTWFIERIDLIDKRLLVIERKLP